MHYKNGRLAQEGDPVICTGYNGQITVGKIHSLVPGSTSCNCTVAEPVIGGVNQLTCRTIGDMYHAQDAFGAMDRLHAFGAKVPEVVAVKSNTDQVPQAPPADNAHVAEGCEKFAEQTAESAN